MNRSGAESSWTDKAERLTQVMMTLELLVNEIQTLLRLADTDYNEALLRGIKNALLVALGLEVYTQL